MMILLDTPVYARHPKANDLVFLTHDAKLNDYNEPCVLCV